jgi:hypothetical protein
MAPGRLSVHGAIVFDSWQIEERRKGNPAVKGTFIDIGKCLLRTFHHCNGLGAINPFGISVTAVGRVLRVACVAHGPRVAQGPVRSSCALRVATLGRLRAVLRRRRSGDRQQFERENFVALRDRPQELALSGQRSRRSDRGDPAQLHGQLQGQLRRAVGLHPRHDL